MVQEIRKIILTAEELISALDAHRRVTPDFLPEGEIVDCKPLENGDVELRLAMSADKEVPHTHVSFKPSDILKPLIRFCIENNIMLPKNGRKSISTRNGTIVLRVALNMDTDILDNVSVTLG